MTMIQSIQPPLSFEEFLAQCPQDGKRYELVDGQIVELMATRQHDDIADFILFALNDEVRRLDLNYRVANKASIKVKRFDGLDQGRTPDVSVIDKTLWQSDPKAYSALDVPFQLAVEVVSTNWRDDYLTKLAEYEAVGVHEYWIVDYLALGAVRYIGKPKQPVISVYWLEDGEYLPVKQFKGNDPIESLTFPDLVLTADQIFGAGDVGACLQ